MPLFSRQIGRRVDVFYDARIVDVDERNQVLVPRNDGACAGIALECKKLSMKPACQSDGVPPLAPESRGDNGRTVAQGLRNAPDGLGPDAGHVGQCHHPPARRRSGPHTSGQRMPHSQRRIPADGDLQTLRAQQLRKLRVGGPDNSNGTRHGLDQMSRRMNGNRFPARGERVQKFVRTKARTRTGREEYSGNAFDHAAPRNATSGHPAAR